MKEELVNEIATFLKNEVVNNPGMEIEKDEEIITRGLIDSMGIVRLITHIQNRYNIEEIDHKDMILDNFKSIDKIADMVLGYLEERV